MREIPLTQGTVALVDDEDYPELSKFKWQVSYGGSPIYATRQSLVIDGKPQRLIAMHRAIMNTPAGMETDHINGNGLDNRRENLRVVTRRENQQNRHVTKTSKYPGVSWNKINKKWTAQIHIEGRSKCLGSFDDEIAAANAYTDACQNLSNIAPSKSYGKKNRSAPKGAIRIGDDCIAVLEKWRHEHESLSDAVRRMDRHLKKHRESGVK